MHLIAKQPYVKIQRKIIGAEQLNIEHERNLCLYTDKIMTQYREFPIHEVLDMSYRSVGSDVGFLYLHTVKGIYAYIVKNSPQSFINAYKEL